MKKEKDHPKINLIMNLFIMGHRIMGKGPVISQQQYTSQHIRGIRSYYITIWKQGGSMGSM